MGDGLHTVELNRQWEPTCDAARSPLRPPLQTQMHRRVVQTQQSAGQAQQSAKLQQPRPIRRSRLPAMAQNADDASSRPFHHVAVFCGASSGKNPAYVEAARALGREMSAQGLGLVYGGGTVGLMGEIARTVLAASGPDSVYGVIPKELSPRELSGEMIGQLVVVDDMHTRKALMAKRADGFIGMPGGFGTLEELLEVITWQQLGFHAKPVGLLNIGGFYDRLLGFFDHCVSEGFIRPQHNTVLVSSDPKELLQMMRDFKAPTSHIEMAKMAAAGISAVGMDVNTPADGNGKPAQ